MTSNELFGLVEPASIRQQLTSAEQIAEEHIFDYSDLDSEVRIVVQKRTDEIRSLVRQTARDIIDIGQKLTEVKQQLGHGKFRNWLKVEFKWGIWTAAKFMQVAERFKGVNFTHLNIATSALYLLAAPSTAEAVLQKALKRAEQGENMTHAKVKAIVKQDKKVANFETNKLVTIDLPAETIVRDSSASDKSCPGAQIVAAQSTAVGEQSEDKLPGKEAPAQFQATNHFHQTPLYSSGDYTLEDRAKIDIHSLFGIGNLIYFTDPGQQESRLLGEVAEIQEVTTTEVVVRISLNRVLSTTVVDNF